MARRTPDLSSARRSRRISCTRVPYRNPPARDPSPLAQDDKSGVRRLFHNNGSFEGRFLGMELPNRFVAAREGHDPPLQMCFRA